MFSRTPPTTFLFLYIQLSKNRCKQVYILAALHVSNLASRLSNKCYPLNDFTRANDKVASGAPPSLSGYIVPTLPKCQQANYFFLKFFSGTKNAAPKPRQIWGKTPVSEPVFPTRKHYSKIKPVCQIGLMVTNLDRDCKNIQIIFVYTCLIHGITFNLMALQVYFVRWNQV